MVTDLLLSSYRPLTPVFNSPDPEAPLVVPGLRVVASDATRIRVAWGLVPGATGFRIIWKTGSGQCGVCGLLRGNLQSMG